MTNDKTTLLSMPNSQPRVCDACEVGRMQKTMERQLFKYGLGDNAVQLSALIPVWKCDKCDHGYTDEEAEDLRHAAVCQHIGVLSPRELCKLRKDRGLSQEDLAELTGFGLASIKRWETGAVIQNTSADRFLRLLQDSSVYEKAIILAGLTSSQATISAQPQIVRAGKFISSLPERTKRDAEIFVLRPQNCDRMSACM